MADRVRLMLDDLARHGSAVLVGPDAHAWVRVRRNRDALVLEIVEDGAGRAAGSASPV